MVSAWFDALVFSFGVVVCFAGLVLYPLELRYSWRRVRRREAHLLKAVQECYGNAGLSEVLLMDGALRKYRSDEVRSKGLFMKQDI